MLTFREALGLTEKRFEEWLKLSISDDKVATLRDAYRNRDDILRLYIKEEMEEVKWKAEREEWLKEGERELQMKKLLTSMEQAEQLEKSPVP